MRPLFYFQNHANDILPLITGLKTKNAALVQFFAILH